MKDIEVIVTRRDTLCSDFVWLVTKSKNSYKFLFNFLSPWDEDLKLQAIFKAPYQAPIVVDLDENQSCVVPYEATVRTGVLFIALRGIKEQSTNLLDIEDSYSVVKFTSNLEIPIIKGVL